MEKRRVSEAEATEAYPDEWVMMNELDRDSVTGEVRTGVVLAHAKTRKELRAAAPWTDHDSRSIFYTGEKRSPLEILLGLDPV